MRLASALIVACCAWTACSAVGTATSVPIDVDRPFRLKVGQTAMLAREALQVGMAGVTSDSRCPRDEQCVTAGDAVVRVWWQRGGTPRESRDLHLDARAVRSARIGELELRLLALEPVAVSGQTIAQEAYVATLLLSRNPADEASR